MRGFEQLSLLICIFTLNNCFLVAWLGESCLREFNRGAILRLPREVGVTKCRFIGDFMLQERISHSISVLKATNCYRLKVLIVYNLLRCFPLAFSEAAAIVRQVTIAIAHLHSLNIAHRDLKVQCTIICTDLTFNIKHIVNNTLWTPLVFTSFIFFIFFFYSLRTCCI